YEPTAHGLSGILRGQAHKISGIINGIDVELNDPKKDRDIPYNFSMSNLDGKARNKAELQKRFSLAVRPEAPVIAMISRLAEHKGFDLMMCVGREIMQNDVQLVLLGTGEKKYEDYFRALAWDFPGRVGVSISYDRALSKLIYAGADMFLMPSKSEACGLAQMIASRYGTVPIVHEVGGLYDTIKPYTGKSGNGFTFAAYNAHDMLYVIREAESVYRRPEEWAKLQKRIMKIDFSWDVSAEKYLTLYSDLLA
ncbi:MAG: glycosyltransferase, partial [Clostridia bacterium]|nr:glycosyltransferase [Clostridia bacterium]